MHHKVSTAKPLYMYCLPSEYAINVSSHSGKLKKQKKTQTLLVTVLDVHLKNKN